MDTRSPQNNNKPGRFFRKFLLAAFVVLSFIVYAISKPFYGAQGGLSQISPIPSLVISQPVSTSTLAGNTDTSLATQPDSTSTAADTAVPSDTPQPVIVATTAVPATSTLASAGLYKDGTYNGPQVDAFYGYVQVQVIIQNGKIATVNFLQYPSDRRTSQRINSIAIPYLQQEAISAQNANVDIITGATLTSEGFQQSLQSALSQAHS